MHVWAGYGRACQALRFGFGVGVGVWGARHMGECCRAYTQPMRPQEQPIGETDIIEVGGRRYTPD